LDARLGAKAIRRSNELPDELVILKILRQADVPIFASFSYCSSKKLSHATML
jgi:hypothetical protein